MSTDTQNNAPVSAEPVAVPDAILLMAQRIAADDFEHCTSDPIFTVEKRNLITGLDLDYTDNIGWFCEGEQIDDEDAAVLEAAYQESGNVPDNYTRTGIEETWEHFATYVTLEAAREFVSKKGDQYRVYVDSGCRNHEWKALRAFLLQIAANPVLAAPLAAQPDLTQQTLDDVKAGIPARDAEIKALRRELETLQAQLKIPTVVHSNMCRGIIAPVTFDMLAHVLGDEAKQEWMAAQSQQTPSKWFDDFYHLAESILADAIRYGGDVINGSEYGRRKRPLFDHVESLRDAKSAQVDKSTEKQGKLVDESPNLQSQQQPVSGADGLPTDLEIDRWAEDLSKLGYWANQEDAEADLRKLFSHLAALAQQDADKVDTALAEMVHVMFRSGNDVPVTRIAIDRKQYEAAIDAVRKEPGQ